jgi:glycosyltransferase involved in cell wall biosynthesis
LTTEGRRRRGRTNAEYRMNQAGLVSILLPNRNHEHYLPRALDAILAQTWDKLELIVIDDASTDCSRELVSDYARRDRRVRLLPLEQHHGIGAAVNAGLAVANGEYIHTAAADDYIAPVLLEHCAREMARFPGAGLCFSDPTEFHEKGQRSFTFPLYLSERPQYFEPRVLAGLLARNYFHISANTGVYRTQAFRDAGGYIPDLKWHSDWFVTLVVALRHGACYLPEQLTQMTIRDDSYSARSLRGRTAQRPLLEKILRLLSQPQYADVAQSMREAGLLPEYQLRTLIWLMQNSEGRKFINQSLVRRIFGRQVWSFLRPIMPVEWRRRLRRAASERARLG